MSEEKKTVELKDEELKETNGGTSVEDCPKFSAGQHVKYKDWAILEIIQFDGYDSLFKVNDYKTTIVSYCSTCSPTFSSAYPIGSIFFVSEDDLLSIS